MEKKNKQALKLVTFLGLGFLIGLFLRVPSRMNLNMATSTGSNLSLFDSVYQTISEYWVNTTDEEINLEIAAVEGFVNNLGDPHTTYMSQETLENFTTSVDGSFAGIGVSFSMTDGGGKISSIIQETPAQEAGLQPLDIITHIDGVSIDGYTAEEVKEIVRGKEGTSVKVTVLRDGESLDFNIVRRKIDSSVTWEIREDKIGYLDINTFGNLTDQSIEKALKYFKANNIEIIAIDLRDNSGGYLSSVQNILGLFLEKGKLLFSIQEKEGPAIEYKSINDTTYTFKQGYILMNGNTASASEVMAGCLSEQLGYQMIGKTSYGKGTAQTQMMLSDMTSIKYTYAKWLVPSGKCINGIGLEPDIMIDDLEINDFYVIQFDEVESIEYDSVSMDVANMQKMLSVLGYHDGREDGYFDEATKTALQAFEYDNDLESDGALNKDDYLHLEQALVSHFNDLLNDASYQRLLEEVR